MYVIMIYIAIITFFYCVAMYYAFRARVLSEKCEMFIELGKQSDAMYAALLKEYKETNNKYKELVRGVVIETEEGKKNDSKTKILVK